MVVKFLRIDGRYANDGSPTTAFDYVYDVDGQEVFVEVEAMVIHNWNVSGPGSKQISEHDVKQAVVALLESEEGRGWSPRASSRLVLNELNVMPIAIGLGWKPR